MKNRIFGTVVTLWMALGLPVLALENLALDRRAQVLQGAWLWEPRVVDGDSDTCSQYQGSDWNVPLSAEPVTWIRVVGPRNGVLPPVNIFSPKCAESARVFQSGHVMDWVCGTGAHGSSLSLQLSPSRLCEIKVIKGLIVNVALGKPAAQSSTFDGTDGWVTPPLTYRASADLAVDGAPTKNYADKTCAVTDWPSPRNCTLNPWWFVYLGQSYDIIKIDVHGRNDVVARQPIEIRTGNQLIFSGDKDPFNHTDFAIPFEPPLIADSINISMSNCTILDLCEIEIFGVKHGDTCASAPCENGATCREGFVDFSCICAPGFTGRACRDNIDECSSSPCLHGSVCQDGINGYTCTCLPGYTGVNCETDMDECSSSPCLNGGSCRDGVNSFTCTCLLGFIGVTCQTGNLTAALNTGVVQVFADKAFTKRLIFDTSASANLTAFMGRTTFISVSHMTPLPLYSMLMVRSCHARSNSGATDDLSLELIHDGCAVHPGVHVLARRNHVTYFSYEIVSLVNAKPSVYVNCDVDICLHTDWSDRCILHC